jgi:hypothetical protein
VHRGPNGEPVAYDDQFSFLDGVKLNPPEKFEELFEAAGQYTAEREHTKYDGQQEGLFDFHKMTDPQVGCEWVRWCYDHAEEVDEPQWYALACQFSQFANGRDLFHEWSAQDKVRYSARSTDKKYDQALQQNKPHGCETIRGLGGNCECDRRFPGKVYHPCDLAKIAFKTLVESVGADAGREHTISEAAEGFEDVIARLLEIERDPEAGQGRRYGIDTLDAATRLRESDLIIIAARPGMGKTAFAGSVMNFGALRGEPQFFFSAEMAKRQFWQRQLSVVAKVSQTRMSTGQLTAPDWQKIREAEALTKNSDAYPIFVDDMSRSTDRIFDVAARLVARHGKGTIWIDYLQLLQRLPRESMFDAVTRITHDLKLLAKALQCPVVALTQLNRTADDATGESQTNDSWLRGSGDIEQAADVIMFLLGEKGPGVKERICALHKERHREGGLRIHMEFDQPTMTFAALGSGSLAKDGASKGPPRRRPDAPTVGAVSARAPHPEPPQERVDVMAGHKAIIAAAIEARRAQEQDEDSDPLAGLDL